MTNADAKPYLTPAEIAKLLRVSQHKVLGWIHRAELQAVNVSNGTRPWYRVSQDALDSFTKSREVQPPTPRYMRRQQTPERGPIDPILGEKLLKKGEAVKHGNQYFRVWDGIILFY
jgi:excisionase family DNA binding protein